MPAVAIVTLVIVALTILTLAVYLVSIAWILKHVNFTLGTVIAGVRAIGNQTEPLRSITTEINSELAGVQGALEGLLEKKAREKQPTA